MQSGLSFDPLELAREIEAPSRIAISIAVKFLVLGLAGYAVALVAGMPARTVLAWSGADAAAHEASGTVWNGRAAIGRGVAATWRVAPFRSLGQLVLAADLAVDGPDTALTGRVRVRPGTMTLDDVAGRAGWPLIAALAPSLPMTCSLSVGVQMNSIVLAGRRSGAEGRLTSGAGTCRMPGGASAQLPALVAIATHDGTGSRAWLTPLTGPGTRLAEASLNRDGAVKAELLPAGSALFPPGAFGGGMTLETRL